MADLPILFSAPMVRAILREIEARGTGKTQTRRVINPQPFADGYFDGDIDCTPVPAQASNLSDFFRFGAAAVGGGAMRTYTWTPRYAVGDRLYVREAWRTVGTAGQYDRVSPRDLGPQVVWYEADGAAPPEEFPGKFRQGMHMPRWASRITLIVTEVRVQRLQEISVEDARAEGIPEFAGDAFRLGLVEDNSSAWHDWDNRSSVENYRSLWNSLNADRGFGWDANPWVAAYTFTVQHGNIDEIGQ